MKFYAVKSGRIPGIYESWEGCKAQVDKFKSAEYKSFATREEAEAYMSGQMVTTVKEPIEYEYPFAFVDGSYNNTTNTYGYGGFLMLSPNKYYMINGSGNQPEMAAMRNVAGEILGAMEAIKMAKGLGLQKVTIYYDYEGIAKWATGEWKRNKRATIQYFNFIQEAKKYINLNFVHVEAHTGIPGNEEADKIAKQAVGKCI